MKRISSLFLLISSLFITYEAISSDLAFSILDEELDEAGLRRLHNAFPQFMTHQDLARIQQDRGIAQFGEHKGLFVSFNPEGEILSTFGDTSFIQTLPLTTRSERLRMFISN